MLLRWLLLRLLPLLGLLLLLLVVALLLPLLTLQLLVGCTPVARESAAQQQCTRQGKGGPDYKRDDQGLLPCSCRHEAWGEAPGGRDPVPQRAGRPILAAQNFGAAALCLASTGGINSSDDPNNSGSRQASGAHASGSTSSNAGSNDRSSSSNSSSSKSRGGGAAETNTGASGGSGRSRGEPGAAAAAAARGGVLFISVLGRDPPGDMLAAHCQSLGLPPRGLMRPHGAATPCVSIVFDSSGEVAASVADVAALERHLTPEALAGFSGDVARARLCVDVLHQLAYITPNADELRAIAAEHARRGGGRHQAQPQQQQRQQREEQHRGPPAGASGGGGADAAAAAARQLADIAPAAAPLLASGLGAVVLTLGEAGAALLTLERSIGGGSGGGGGAEVVARHIPAAPAHVRSVSGAGDCLAAGFAAALARGAAPGRALAEGTLAARAAVECEGNVPGRAALVAAVGDEGAVTRQLARMRVLRFRVASPL
ncbi:hypothetical protein MNEG_12197 [Monoraphidium neglectum]|uniref:Carbohydrate kinase PfkB domain-containing protein n=1 Tax=Monoraphidium neglectum TaxID=145388 RepID=A0A0D2M355_9CHLO|nr:hypothetical protein MNEG_12197 [Monoraphidium neglectum]KIY95766.1 hypothetical protein MNEG_12197 [Monoraphidium neglectum]|eukprot:XP_013894786.1 hypothetical protein MNEG_12197 [Monoraphidium neglectum]